MADNQTIERDQDVVAYTAFTGLRNDVTPERFEQGDLATATNVDLDRTGRISRRAGYSLVMPGTMHSLWADEEQTICVVARAGELLQVKPDYTTAFMKQLQGVGLRLSYTKVNDRVYYSNGVDTGIIEQGAVRSWGIVPPVLPGVSVINGAMPAGTYQFSITYLRHGGQESGAPLAGLVTVPAQGGLLFTLPVPTDPDITAKRIYVSSASGDMLYQALTTGAGTLVEAYTNDTTELALPLETQFFTGAPAGQLVGYYRGCMFVAANDILYYSKPYAYEQFDPRDYIALDGRITLLAPMTDKFQGSGDTGSGFFIATDRSCGVLAGLTPGEFQYVPKTNYGAVLGALSYVDGSMFGDNSTGARMLPMWLSQEGVCVGLPDMNIRNLTRTRYQFTTAGEGAAIFMTAPNRFIATSSS